MAKVGRPQIMDKYIIAKLEDAYSVGATDVEACFFANISKDTLYRYFKKHPEFCERKEALKNSLKFRSRKLVSKSVDEGNVGTATWYLERKAREEFSSRQELTGADGERLIPNADEKTKADQALNNYLEDYGTGANNSTNS